MRRLAAALPERLRTALVADAERHVFTPPDPRAGGAFAMSPDAADPAVRAARTLLTALAHRHGFAGFTPDEFSYQRYEPTGRGLPPHRDQRFYVQCIVIVTLEGRATFGLHGSRALDDLVGEWTTRPGEVILLAGGQPGSPTDRRPWHRVDPPAGRPRLMFQLRQRLTPASPAWHLLSDTERHQADALAATHTTAAAGGGTAGATDSRC